MTVETPFSSPQEAEDAYYGDEGPGDDPPGTTDGWGDPQQSDQLQGGWALLYQDQTDGSRRRWFVAGGPNGGFLNTSGGVVTPDSNETMDDMPSFDTEQEARDAHAAWVEQNDEEAEDDEPAEWSEWTELEEVSPWFIYSRENAEEDRVQFVVAGENNDGDIIYLHPGGAVEYEQHIYEDPDELGDALDAYFQAAQDGDVPEDRQPTGSKPARDDIEDDTDDAAGDPGELVGAALEAVTSNPLLAAGAAVGGYYAYQNYGDMT